ncbi:ThiF family adenylyltransferase [Mucilaginibacter sp.]|uniref:ThiF family adenylyltransferase n=1 Tax=Mucilaginibacter sp. TaxID=1882438 RepID=UPI00262E70D8|nr:ThiF family adenylyltransferase [Mucilaginibacter sp.]
MDDFFDLPIPSAAQAIELGGLHLPKAIAFARIIVGSKSSAIIELISITADGDSFFKKGDEIVVFDTYVNVGQNPVNDIRYQERIAIHFDVADQRSPWVYALRKTFPKVPHRNALNFDEPQCICIYETTYEELKLEWRPAKFLADIRSWLSLTADGKLHQNDQPLEPLLVFNMGTIIIPSDLKDDETLHIYSINKKRNYLSLIASRVNLADYDPFHNHLIQLKGTPQPNGVMGRTPPNLKDLHSLLTAAGIDLFAALRTKLSALPKTAEILQKKLILLLELPKAVAQGIYPSDYYVFLTAQTIEEIGLSLGFWTRGPLGIADILFEEAAVANAGEDLTIGTLVPQVQLSPDLAFKLGGNKKDEPNKNTAIFQIGVGALGSQFLLNLVRMGFGKWVITDDDFLLPHNLVRHALDSPFIGNFKTDGLAMVANNILNTPDFVTPLNENFLYPENKTLFDQYLIAAEVIVDISTSVAVARNLAARKELKARKISIFLNPTGSDLVILAEDKARRLTFDKLEYQYYGRLIHEPSLSDHLFPADGVRISNSCRDITSVIPQEYLAILSGIASNQFRKILSSDLASIGIWRINRDTMEVNSFNYEPPKFEIHSANGWKIYIDQALIIKISQYRLTKLPNETGGILIGGYDFEHKSIYLVDTILSPEDSEEFPNAYVRGIKGVKEQLELFDRQTYDHLKYVGEWHSHPEKCSLRTSPDDKILFASIRKEMEAIGFPPLMLIAGDNNSYQLYMQI